MDTTSTRDTQKLSNANPIETLSKDEIISKYKGLLNIAKKAKQAKDDLTEENRQLKEALRRAAEKQSSLPAMQEMVQDFTDKNLILTEQVQALKLKTKDDAERLSQLDIENESLKRQLSRLSDENDGLLGDVERMEQAMQQVNALGNDQRKNLELLELDIAKLKEAASENASLRQKLHSSNEELQEVQQKYQKVKDLNSEQRKKFNSLKDRFIDVHRKLKNLKECKCVLLETQHEYAASVSKWQREIVKASQLLCGKMTALQEENDKLRQDTKSGSSLQGLNRNRLMLRIQDLERLAKVVKLEQEKENRNEINKDYWLDKLKILESLAQQVARDSKKPTLTFDLSHFQAKLQSMETLIRRLGKEQAQQEVQAIELLQQNEDLQRRFQLKEQEHTELLAEMRELNEALKGRGDLISRLQEQHLVDNKRLKELEVQLAQTEQSLLEKSQKLEELEQSDVLSTSTISRVEELSRLRELDEGYEEKYHKLRALAAKLKKKLQDQTSQLKEMDQAAALKQELESIKLAQVQLQQDLNASRAENQKLKSKEKGKHTSVLNLEIEATEKSLADVSGKLSLKCQELDAIKETLASKESSIGQLRQEICLLEQSQNAEALHAKQLKEHMDRMQVQVKDALHSQQQALNQAKEMEHQVEQSKLEAEQLRLQLAESAQAYESKLSKSQHLLNTRTQELERHLEEHKQLEMALGQAERAQEDLRVEYTEYKVKAQAVLRKNQNKGFSDKEQELIEELTNLRRSEESLRASNEGRAERLAQLDQQLDAVRQDNTNLQRRSKELLSVVDELRQQNDSLTQDNQRQLQFQHDLMQQHREQMDQMDAGHQLQVRQLQQQVEESLKKITRHQQQKVSAPVKGDVAEAPSLEQTKIDYLLMDHEAGDASLAQLAAQRKISTASRRSHDFMPLDELLNTSLNQITSDTVTTISNFGRSVSMQEEDEELAGEEQYAIQSAQLLVTKEELSRQESRVKHLTSLLAENEQDLAKLTQMNDMLKEELRRQERSEEREQHMHNSEYLKNVFLKFLTLNNADERQRLVPVLNTILRLSRNEMDMLNCVAKGQRVSNEGGNRSWTGFLTTAWSGVGGGANNNSN